MNGLLSNANWTHFIDLSIATNSISLARQTYDIKLLSRLG